MAFQGRVPKTLPPAAADAPAATLRVKFWPEPFEKERQRPPRRRNFNAARAGMCARPKRALVIHTWEVSCFAQFHTGTKRS